MKSVFKSSSEAAGSTACACGCPCACICEPGQSASQKSTNHASPHSTVFNTGSASNTCACGCICTPSSSVNQNTTLKNNIMV